MGSQNAPITSALIVGGCGFLGHHIVDRLLRDLPTAHLSVLEHRTTHNRCANVDYSDGDITSADRVDAVLAAVRPQVLFHTASPTSIRYDTAIFDRVNIRGTQTLLDCAARCGSVRAFIFTSSASVVHDGRSNLLFGDETLPVLDMPPQESYYSWSKGVAEQAVLAANRRGGAPGATMLTVAVRPCALVGEGDVQFLPPVLDMYLTGRHFWQLGANRNLFDVTYVANAAHAHVLAARALWQTAAMRTRPLDFERVDGEAFTVTNDETVPFWTLVHMVWRAAGWKGTARDAWVIPRLPGLITATIVEWLVWIVTLGTREAQFKHQAVQYSCMWRSFNIDKAKRRLGYRPIVGLEDGIGRGVRWILDQRAKERKETASHDKAG